MSYRIEYGCAVPAKFRHPAWGLRLQILTAVCMILFSLIVGRSWPQGREMLREYLLAGEPAVTEQAFSGLVQDLSRGMGLEEAMTVFCRQIMDHGAGE